MTLYYVKNQSTISSRMTYNYLVNNSVDFVYMNHHNWGETFTEEVFRGMVTSIDVLTNDPPIVMKDIVAPRVQKQLVKQGIDLDDMTISELFNYFKEDPHRFRSGFLYDSERGMFKKGYSENALEVFRYSKEERRRRRLVNREYWLNHRVLP